MKVIHKDGAYYSESGFRLGVTNNTIMHADGSFSTILGNSIIHSDGTSSFIVGNATNHLDGTSHFVVGNMANSSDCNIFTLIG